MADFDQAPPGINPRIPNAARIYDYSLGGKDNFAADREVVDRLSEMGPQARYEPVENRGFLIRAVRFLVEEAGIRQFIDICSGLPTQQNVHEVAFGHAPDSRVVYVDHDAIVVTHARALLRDPRVAILHAEAREPQAIIDHPEVRALIDFSQPVAVLFVAVLHWVPDDVQPIVATWRDRMTPGSHLVVSHGTSDGMSQTSAARFQGVMQAAREKITLRSAQEITALFDGFELLEPGLVRTREWRPDDQLTPDFEPLAKIVAGVGRKLP